MSDPDCAARQPRRASAAPRRWCPGDDPGDLVTALAAGALLFLPTESSYGIGVDPRSRRGVDAVFALKGRDGGKPLPVVLAAADQVAALGVDAAAPDVAVAVSRCAGCWPGPLTVILPLAGEASGLPAAAGSGGIAVRVPDHEALRAALEVTGPLTATSANPSGEPPFTDPDDLLAWLRRDPPPGGAVVVDGGRLPGGAPSTLVRFDERGVPRVLRPGRVSEAELAACLGSA